MSSVYADILLLKDTYYVSPFVLKDARGGGPCLTVSVSLPYLEGD